MSIPAATRGTLFIVLNVRSGRPDETVRDSAERVLGAAGRPFELLEVADGSDLPAAAARAVTAAKACAGTVVAAGGDGTLNTVAAAVLGSGCPFGVVAQGTFNYFARAHGLPLDNDGAMRALADGLTRPVQVGLVNDHVFLVNASVGLYPQLLEDREAWKARFGRFRLVAWASGLATLLGHNRQLRLTIDVDGDGPAPPVAVRTPTVFVGNNRLQLEQIGIAEAAEVERGRLVAIVLKPVGTAALFALFLRGAVGRLGDADAARGFATAALTVARPRGLLGRRIKIATDGEVHAATLPLVFRVAAERLQLIVPKEAAA